MIPFPTCESAGATAISPAPQQAQCGGQQEGAITWTPHHSHSNHVMLDRAPSARSIETQFPPGPVPGGPIFCQNRVPSSGAARID